MQEFHIVRIQPRKNVLETNIIVIHDQTPQISLPHSSFLRSRPHSRRHDDVCLTTPTSSLSSSSFSKVFESKRDCFSPEVKIGVFFRERQDNCLMKTTDMKTTLREQLARYERIRKRPSEREKKRERERENRERVHLREREMEEVRATPREYV